MGQTSTLFGARRRALANARAAGVGVYDLRVMAAGTCVLAGIVLAGELAAAGLLATPSEMATPVLGKRAPVVGDGALEAAFWACSLLSAFFAFRVMESLFRSPHVRALELLPVAPGPIFVERTVNALLEGTALAFGLSLFFLPLAWHGHLNVAALCGAMALGATTCTAAMTIGINAWFGAQYGGSSGLGDGYGGQGGAFIYAPMVALSGAVACNFMLQLGAREVLHDGRLTNASMLAGGIALLIAASALVVGGRHFVSGYHRVAAFFREADEVGFRAVLDYQQSTWLPIRFEELAGDGAPIFRRHATQFPRRFPVGRSLVFVGSIAAVIAAGALSAAAFPSWALAMTPALLFALLERPFTRIFDERLGTSGDVLMPVSADTVERSTAIWWYAEVGRIALPFGVFAGAVRGWTNAVDGALVTVFAIGASAALCGAISIVRRLGQRSTGATHMTALLLLIILGGVGAYSLPVGVVVSMVFATATSAIALRKVQV